MGFIRVAANGFDFVDESTGEKFVPVGTNYANCIGGYTAGDKAVGYSFLFGTDPYTQKDGLKEALDNVRRLGDLGLNLLRVWPEPNLFFPHGLRLDPRAAEMFDRFLEVCGTAGLRVTIGIHLCPVATGWRLHSFEPPHQERLLQHHRAFALRWGDRPEVFSWTIVGEGFLPWQTKDMVSRWPAWLRTGTTTTWRR